MKKGVLSKLIFLTTLTVLIAASAGMPVNALEAVNTAQLFCSDGKVVIKASFTNKEVGDRYTYEVVPSDRQTNVTGEAKTVAPGATENWELRTQTTTLNRGTVHFDIQRVDDAGSQIFRLVQYEALNCNSQNAPQLPRSTNPQPTVPAAPAQNQQASGQFDFTHSVRIKGSATWQDKVASVSKSDVVELLVQVTNKSSSAQTVQVKVELPAELTLVSGTAATTLANIPASQRKDVILTAQLKPTVAGEKCVVSKAQLDKSGTRVTSDLATVCYGTAAVTTLPTTGPAENMIMSLSGMFLIVAGFALKKSPKLAEIVVR